MLRTLQLVREHENEYCGGAGLSLEECLDQWRAERERAEVIAQIQQSVEDIEAGRFYTLDEVDEHIRLELDLSPRPQ